MDTTTPRFASIGIDIGKEVFHIVGFGTDGKIAFRRKVSPTSTLRLVSDPGDLVSTPAGFSGKLTLTVEGCGRPDEEVEAETCPETCFAGLTKATGLATVDGGAETATGGLLVGALWRPTE
jgi:hypothetical protein